MVRSLVLSISFAFAFAVAPTTVNAQQVAAQPKVTFGADFVATSTVSRFDTTPNPVSSMEEANEDYDSGSFRYVFALRLDDRNESGVSIRRDSLGRPDAWALSTSGEIYDLNPRNEWLSNIRQQYRTKNTVIDFTHRVKLGHGFSATAGMTYAVFNQKVSYQVIDSFEEGEAESDYSFIGPVGGLSYSQEIGRVTLTGETSIGALHQSGSESSRYKHPTTTRVHSNRNRGTIWSMQHQLTGSAALKITQVMDLVGTYSFRTIHTADAYYMYQFSLEDSVPNQLKTGSLSIGFRVRP